MFELDIFVQLTATEFELLQSIRQIRKINQLINCSVCKNCIFLRILEQYEKISIDLDKKSEQLVV